MSEFLSCHFRKRVTGAFSDITLIICISPEVNHIDNSLNRMSGVNPMMLFVGSAEPWLFLDV
jgi:hypothetical protein